MARDQSFTVIDAPRLLAAAEAFIKEQDEALETKIAELIDTWIGRKVWPWSKVLTRETAESYLSGTYDSPIDTLHTIHTLYVSRAHDLVSLAKIAGTGKVMLMAEDAAALEKHLT